MAGGENLWGVLIGHLSHLLPKTLEAFREAVSPYFFLGMEPGLTAKLFPAIFMYS